EHRLQQFVPDGASCARHSRPRVSGTPHQPCEREIICGARTGHTSVPAKYPPRNRTIVGTKNPAFLASHVHESELGALRSEQTLTGPDCVQIVLYRPIARQDQMIAIVDHAFERRIVIRAAAPASRSRRLDDLDPAAPLSQRNGGGKPGETGANNVHLAA